MRRPPLLLLLMAHRGTMTSGESLLPLITTLQHRHGNLVPVHPQRQSWGRRLAAEDEPATLTRDNTAPMRIRLDFQSLYTPPPYSACFSACDPRAARCDHWFRRDLPASRSPPANGVETCVRDGTAASLSRNLRDGCWGRCLARDVIRPHDRDKLIEVVTELSAELSTLLAVKPVDGLRFTVSEGAYKDALRSRGYPSARACARDCTVLSNVAVDPAYCGSGGLGAGYDVVLSVTKPPGLRGVAGTGSSCASDTAGRPLWLVIEWHDDIVGLGRRSTADLVSAARPLATRHQREMLHGPRASTPAPRAR